MSIVRKILPCPSYDIAKLETWFKDCAAEGLFLKTNSIGMLTAQFETGEAKTMTYRFEPSAYLLNTDEILDENNRNDKIAFLEEAGWKLTASHRQYFVFAHEGTAELHSDPQTESIIRMDLARVRTVQLLRACVPFLFYGFLLSSHFMQMMIRTGSWIFIAAIPFAIAGVIGHLSECVRLYTEASKLEKGEPFHHEKDWRPTAPVYRIFIIMRFCMYTLLAAALLAMAAAEAGDAGRISLKDHQEDPPFMTVSDIDPEAEYVMNSFAIESLRRQFPTLNTMRHYSDLFSKDNYIWTEDAYLKQGEGTLSCFMDLNYHDTRYDFVAERLYKEYAGDYGDPAFAQRFSGCDEISGTEDENGLILFVFRKGNRIVSGSLHASRGPEEYVTSEILQKLIGSVHPES